MAESPVPVENGDAVSEAGAGEAPLGTLTALIREAVQQRRRSLVLQEDVVSPDEVVVLPREFSIAGDPGRAAPVRLVCRCLRVAFPVERRCRSKGPGACAALRRVRLEGGGGGAPALRVERGGRALLEDCQVQSASVGVELLGPGSSALLLRTSVVAAEEGVLGRAGARVVLRQSRVTECGADGLSLEAPRGAWVLDSYLAGNVCNGVLLILGQGQAAGRGRPAPLVFCGNSLQQNSQYGVCLEQGGRQVRWCRNFSEGNGLGEKGGSGALDGFEEGRWLGPGDECLAWMEKRAAWVKAVACGEWGASVRVRVERPGKRRADGSQAHEEVDVPPQALRPPRYTEAHLPPAWSKRGPRRARSALEHFLEAQGLSKGDPEARARFEAAEEATREAAREAQRRDRARFDADASAISRARSREAALAKVRGGAAATQRVGPAGPAGQAEAAAAPPRRGPGGVVRRCGGARARRRRRARRFWPGRGGHFGGDQYAIRRAGRVCHRAWW
ncbi:unnamed protein product [Prorocentrum cordatum]|uniref:Right handed beta helix domain-containing protein n=1 Tax=Prorocentrum cordatum TaxID=2364126 RepID=A0ABN9QUB2_9DINO|nr:unnamed protein product [Polarella glacialis]